MYRYLIGLFAALLLSLTAHAVITPTSGYSCYSGSFPSAGTRTGSTQVACASLIVTYLQGVGSVHPDMVATCSAGTGAVCGWNWSGSPHGGQITVNTASICPGNSTLSGGNCSCNSGYVELSGACVADTPECPVGQGITTNRTEGWGRSADPNANDIVEDLGPPSTIYGYNDGQCVGNITGVQRCFRSAEPSAQGLHRVSCDYTMVVTGPSTSPGDATSDPTEPGPACPGFVGEVNGKSVCVGTASNPLPAGTDAPNEPTVAGNPAAGTKPLTGPGSGTGGAGRTPTTGTGGNNGGPASAAVGPGGSGLRNSEGSDDSGAVCGAPPLPSCNVKVDEAGVPAEATAPGRFTQGNTDIDKVKTDADGFFNDHRDITLPTWTWTFAFPSACSALVMPAFNDFEIDVCQFQPIIHDLMSVLWVIAGIWGLIALFQRATGS